MPVVPPKMANAIRRNKRRSMALIRGCCLPGELGGLLILPKANKAEFTRHVRTLVKYYKKLVSDLRRSWPRLTDQAREDALDLLRIRYYKTEERYRATVDFDRLAQDFLSRFAKRVKRGPMPDTPTWTYLQLSGTMSREPRMLGYQNCSSRLWRFLNDSHSKAISYIHGQLTSACAMNPRSYPDPQDFRRKYVSVFSGLKVDLWWNWFDVFGDEYAKNAISALGESWERLRRGLSSRKKVAPEKHLARLKTLVRGVRGSCVEALKRLVSHPAVGAPPVVSGGV